MSSREPMSEWIDRNSYLLTFGACWALLLHRAPGRVASAHLWAEDGQLFFTEFVNQGLLSLFNQYEGYFHTIPRLITALTVSLPVEYWPLAVALISQTITAAVFAIFVRSEFAEYVDKKIVRFFLCLSLCLAPGLPEILSNLANLHWILFLASSLLVLQKSFPRPLFKVPIVSLIFLSAGECIVLMPLLVFQGWKAIKNSRHQAWRQMEFLLPVILAITAILNFSQRHHQNPGELADLTEILLAFEYSVLGQMVFIPLLGSFFEAILRQSSSTWTYVCIAVVAVGVGGFVLISRSKEVAINLLLIGICTISVPLLIWVVRPESINVFPPGKSFESFYSMRYSFVLFPISLIFWLTVVCHVVDQIRWASCRWILPGLFLLASNMGSPGIYEIGPYGPRVWKDDAAQLIKVYRSRCFNDLTVLTYPDLWGLYVNPRNDGC